VGAGHLAALRRHVAGEQALIRGCDIWQVAAQLLNRRDAVQLLAQDARSSSPMPTGSPAATMRPISQHSARQASASARVRSTTPATPNETTIRSVGGGAGAATPRGVTMAVLREGGEISARSRDGRMDLALPNGHGPSLHATSSAQGAGRPSSAGVRPSWEREEMLTPRERGEGLRWVNSAEVQMMRQSVARLTLQLREAVAQRDAAIHAHARALEDAAALEDRARITRDAVHAQEMAAAAEEVRALRVVVSAAGVELPSLPNPTPHVALSPSQASPLKSLDIKVAGDFRMTPPVPRPASARTNMATRPDSRRQLRGSTASAKNAALLAEVTTERNQVLKGTPGARGATFNEQRGTHNNSSTVARHPAGHFQGLSTSSPRMGRNGGLWPREQEASRPFVKEPLSRVIPIERTEYGVGRQGEEMEAAGRRKILGGAAPTQSSRRRESGRPRGGGNENRSGSTQDTSGGRGAHGRARRRSLGPEDALASLAAHGNFEAVAETLSLVEDPSRRRELAGQALRAAAKAGQAQVCRMLCEGALCAGSGAAQPDSLELAEQA